MVDRLPFLKKMVDQRPDDPFPRYGVAMELKSRGDAAQAREAFEQLLEAFPAYVPSYLMYGNLLEEAGDAAAAADAYNRGMEAARAAGDDHALGELEAARDALT